MGLMDILTGMQNGPRGGSQQAPGRGGMSPWMIGLLGLLAYKAVKGGALGNVLGGANPNQAPPMPNPGNTGNWGGAPGRSTGGLGGLLGGALAGGAAGGLGSVLGGLLSGNSGGNVLNGGLHNLVRDMEGNGYGDAARSWVGSGDNQRLDPQDLGRAAGLEDIDAVSQQMGIPREQMLSDLSQHLPEFVNQLTPEGRLPTNEEAGQWV